MGLLKAILFLALATLILPQHLLGGAQAAFSYSSLAIGAKLGMQIAVSFLLFGFLPGLAVDAALSGLFPSWPVLRISLPLVVIVTLLAWAALFWEFCGKYPDIPLGSLRWSLVSAAPVGVLSAGAFMFLLAKKRRPAVPAT